MNTSPSKVIDIQQTPQVFSHNQNKYGYAVLITHSTSQNDWNNPVTMKDLYNKGFYQ